MQVFQFRDNVITNYGDYIRSFINVADPIIRTEVEKALTEGLLWRDPLVQLNPTFQSGVSVDQLVEQGTLHPECGRVFRRNKRSTGGVGDPLLLHKHQEEAAYLAHEGKNYVLCTGTGSGKSLAYIIPIVDHVLRRGSGKGVQAIIVFLAPMYRLIGGLLGSQGLPAHLHMGWCKTISTGRLRPSGVFYRMVAFYESCAIARAWLERVSSSLTLRRCSRAKHTRTLLSFGYSVTSRALRQMTLTNAILKNGWSSHTSKGHVHSTSSATEWLKR